MPSFTNASSMAARNPLSSVPHPLALGRLLRPPPSPKRPAPLPPAGEPPAKPLLPPHGPKPVSTPPLSPLPPGLGLAQWDAFRCGQKEAGILVAALEDVARRRLVDLLHGSLAERADVAALEPVHDDGEPHPRKLGQHLVVAVAVAGAEDRFAKL